MKIKQEHFDYMKSEIERVLARYPNITHEYETGQFPNADKVHNLQTRFNHDLAFGAGLTRFICDNLYRSISARMSKHCRRRPIFKKTNTDCKRY